MALTDMNIVAKSLKHRLFSTVTTALMVAVAVALLLTLLGLRESAAKAFARGTGNMHILVCADDSPLAGVLNSVFYARAPRRAITYQLYRKLSEDGRLAWSIPVQHGDNFKGFPTIATTPEIFTKFQPVAGEQWRFASGRPLADGSDGTWDVVLGAEAARGTGMKVGDKVIVTHGTAQQGRQHDEHPFTIVGILGRTGSPHDRAVFMTLNATWIMHADDARRASANGKEFEEPTEANLTDSEKMITGIYQRVKTREGSESSPAIGMVFDELRRDVRLTVARPSDEVNNLMRIVGNVDRIVLVIAWIVLLSSSISVMLALYNSMEQRRRQIAVLRVLGASPLRIASLVVTESAIVGLIGAAAGLLLFGLGGMLAVRIVQDKLGLVLALQPDAKDVVLVLLGTLALSVLAGLIPAVVGYRTDVVRQLRPIG